MRVTSKITYQPRSFLAGDATEFSISLSKKYYDYKEKTNKYANYQAVIFGKGKQADFYADMLKIGSIVEVSCDAIILHEYEKEGVLKTTMEMVNCKLENVFSTERTTNQNTQQRTPAQNTQQNNSVNDFNGDIPF